MKISMLSPSRRLHAFTLMELLTVIAIIAILMAILFPAVGLVKDQANKTRAKNDVSNIVAAIRTYNVEYGKYPIIEDPVSDEKADAICGADKALSGGSKVKNSAIFNTLRAIPDGLNGPPEGATAHRMNPRRVVFFESRPVSNPEAPRGGFLDKVGSKPDDKGCLFDPWGEQYSIILDQNYDNLLNAPPMPYKDFESPNEIRIGAGAFSLGKDGEIGDKKKGDKMYKSGTETSDDVISWQ